MKQADLIKEMTDKQIRQSLYLSQLLFICIASIGSLFFFSSFTNWTLLFTLDIKQIVYYGILPAIIWIVIQIVLYYLIPKHHFDDGGINERIFKRQSIGGIASIAFLVAISEELLFRGFLQTTFGYIFASVLFAVVHIRYLQKPVLFSTVLFISFGIGYLYEVTGNILVTIVFHFLVDFILGIFIKLQK